MGAPPASLLLEFARAEAAGDPHALRFAPQTYLLRSAGGGFASAELTWSPAFLDDLAALHQPSPDPALVQRIGESLRRFLEAAGWARREAEIIEALDQSRPVILTFRSAAAELYTLPWELVTLEATGQHLGELPGVLLRYEWPQTATAPESPSPRPEGGRVLFAWSAASGAVPAADHERALRAAARAGHLAFDAD